MRGYKPVPYSAGGMSDATVAVPAQPSHDDHVPEPAGVYTGPLASRSFGGEPFAWFMGLGLALFLAGRLRAHPAVPGVPTDVAVSTYNVITIGLMSIVGITLVKTILAKFPVPGLSQIAAAA